MPVSILDVAKTGTATQQSLIIQTFEYYCFSIAFCYHDYAMQIRKSAMPHVYIVVIEFEARSSFIGIIRVESFVSFICRTQLLMFTCLHVEISE